MTEVRHADLGDVAAIAALAQEIHAIHAAALPDIFQPPSATVVTAADFQRLMIDPGHVLLVASEADEIIGYAHAEVQEAPATSYKRASALLHVHAMGVVAARRGRGAGRALLAAVREAARVRELVGVSLEVYAFNGAARAFYEREGFAPLKERLVSGIHVEGP
jgi:ribosomal protein S18 acetylase RimI-like enzyme